ncbi:MAG TPA: ABC transporter ATP-binding protein [Candidatus Deferrimicrobiaceae bacterium]
MNGAERPVELAEVSKSYPTGFWRRRVGVLSRLSFSVGWNEIVGFLGPNGAGKTTTIKILNHLAIPDAGSVKVFGEVAGMRPESRRRIGFMPEQPYFYEYLTGEEFLRLCGHLHGMGRAEMARRVREMLERVGLAGSERKTVRKYSKGMMQRLGLAQALLHDPELVVLDEPMSGLDPMGRMEVRNLIRELKTAGKTVLFSTHIVSDVEALCDRVVMIDRGRKVAEGSVEDLVGKGDTLYVDIVFSPVPSPSRLEAIPHGGSGFAQGDAYLVRARDEEEANRLIAAFRDAGAMVRSCLPVKKRLEDIFMERVAGEADGGR